MRARRLGPALVLGLALLASACTSPARPSPSPSPSPTATTGPAPSRTVERVTVGGIRSHLEALQAIADEHVGTRSVGTPGYEASVAYVAEVLGGAGYEVERRRTWIPVFTQRSPSVLERLGPDPTTWTDGVDFRAALFSAGGDVEGDVSRPTAGTGCVPSDFDGFPAGDVALVEPGPCFRRDQVDNAQAAGASAVIATSTASTGRPVRPTLLTPDGVRVPVLSVTEQLGRELDGTSVRIGVRASSEFRSVESVIAELPTIDGRPVVMLGAHLDSAIDGPGINDNGSGVALLLETARWLAGVDPAPTVRFAFWAGEEEGLYGSREYVTTLTPQEREEIEVYLNLDMVGSPNFVRFVYSDRPDDPEAAATSDEVAGLFERAFAQRGLMSEPMDLRGGSDHYGFVDAGIAVGGLFTGASGEKTLGQAAAYGGSAGEPYDACYHQACDTIDNVSHLALRQNAKALVDALTALLLDRVGA